MKTFKDVVSKWPSAWSMAIAVDVRENAVYTWKSRNRIPSEYWKDIVATEVAQKEGVTLEVLAGLAAQRRG